MSRSRRFFTAGKLWVVSGLDYSRLGPEFSELSKERYFVWIFTLTGTINALLSSKITLLVEAREGLLVVCCKKLRHLNAAAPNKGADESIKLPW